MGFCSHTGKILKREHARSDGPSILWGSLAIVLPLVLAYNTAPSPTFFNQTISMVGWGLWLAWMAALLPKQYLVWPKGVLILQSALAVLAVSAAAAPFWTGLPTSLAVSNTGILLAAMVTLAIGSQVRQAGWMTPIFRMFCMALVIAGVINSLICILQIAAPEWPDGQWIARAPNKGVALGNLRQPNHLATFLLMGIISLMWLKETFFINKNLSLFLIVLMTTGIVLTDSRTAAINILIISAIGALDKNINIKTRKQILLLPIMYMIIWLGYSAWNAHFEQASIGAARLAGQHDFSSSRFSIWSNTLSMIQSNPWLGVGFGGFNFAWTLSSFPDRSSVYLDHAHNFFLHLAAEMGIPITLLVIFLISLSIYKSWGNNIKKFDNNADILAGKSCVAMLMVVFFHSLLEYPLWYVHMLLPVVFIFGLLLGDSPADGNRFKTIVSTENATVESSSNNQLLVFAPLMMAAFGFVALYEYTNRISPLYDTKNQTPLEEKIAKARHSILFSHHGNKILALTQSSKDNLIAFKNGAYSNLTTPFMAAWAESLHEQGDVKKSIYIAHRIKEFKYKKPAKFFQPCETIFSAPTNTPWQCEPLDPTLSYKDFR
jgi:O-antigen ligase